MFEDSVFASGRQVRAGRTKWAVVGALGVQAVVLTSVVAVPLLRPEVLPVVFAAPKVAMVMPKKPVPPKVEVKPAARASVGVSLPLSTAAPVREAVVGRGLGVPRPGVGTEGPGELAVGTGGMGSGGPGLPVGIPGTGGPVVRAATGGAKTMRVSSGVSAGLLITPMRPVYPAIAKAAGVQGTVVVLAMIDKSGRIVGVRVQSGPAMLQSAAVEAVKEARYRPYLLNGEATEVETTISVNFRLGG